MATKTIRCKGCIVSYKKTAPNAFRGSYHLVGNSIYKDVSKGYTVEFLCNGHCQGANIGTVRYITTGSAQNGIAMLHNERYSMYNLSVLGVNADNSFKGNKYSKLMHLVICVPPSNNSENVRIYLNGVKIKDEATAKTERYVNFAIGADYSESSDAYNDKQCFHHVNLFEGCLSDADCISLYNNGYPHNLPLPSKYSTEGATNEILHSFYADKVDDNARIYDAVDDTYIECTSYQAERVVYDWDAAAEYTIEQMAL